MLIDELKSRGIKPIILSAGPYGKRTMRRTCILTILAKALGKRDEFRALGIYPYE